MASERYKWDGKCPDCGSKLKSENQLEFEILFGQIRDITIALKEMGKNMKDMVMLIKKNREEIEERIKYLEETLAIGFYEEGDNEEN
jgi:hypothetical protein